MVSGKKGNDLVSEVLGLEEAIKAFTSKVKHVRKLYPKPEKAKPSS